MPIEIVLFLMVSVLGVVFIWILPREIGLNVLATMTLSLMFALSWQSAIWLLVGSLFSVFVMGLKQDFLSRGVTACILIVLHGIAFLSLREEEGLILLGAAYFTLRQVHVVCDWWIERQPSPRLGDYLRYQFFAPVMIAGPIHRFSHFNRQVKRCRNETANLCVGAERALIGVFCYVVIGSWLFTKLARFFEPSVDGYFSVIHELLYSLISWCGLYFSFAGLSSVAIGLALMMGLKIEENFDKPWKAKDLPDFWSRWHISLTAFSRDYVFRYISASTRSVLVATFSSMLFIGLWHGSSEYWVIWGLWQGLGIWITIWFTQHMLPHRYPCGMGRIFAFFWLILSGPVSERLSGFF